MVSSNMRLPYLSEIQAYQDAISNDSSPKNGGMQVPTLNVSRKFNKCKKRPSQNNSSQANGST